MILYYVNDWEASKSDILVGVKLLEICIKIAMDLK